MSTFYRDEIAPSKSIWLYYDGDISIEQIICHISDLVGGWAISYSATELLKDLKLLTKKGTPTMEAKRLMSSQIHEQYFRKRYDAILVNPITGEKSAR